MSNSEKNLDKTGNAKQSGDQIPQMDSKEVKTAKKLMDSHIKNEKHVITDEEFKNIDVTASLDTDEPLEVDLKKDASKDISKDHRISTPWDVIDE